MAATIHPAHDEALRRHRDWLESARLSASRDRDKIVLTIAGGALTVSAALFEKVMRPTGAGVWFLLAGWVCEVAAVMLVLRSLHCSEKALVSERERVDCMLDNNGKDPEWKNEATGQTEWANVASSFFAVAGVVLLLAQAGLTLTTAPSRTDRPAVTTDSQER